MNSVRLTLGFLFCWFGAAPSTYAGSTPDIELTLYIENDYPPFSYLERQRLRGIYPEILELLAKSLRGNGVLLRVKPINWKRGLLLVESGDAFAIVPPYYWPQLRPYIHPYSEALLAEDVAVYCGDKVVKSRKFKEFPQDFYGLVFANSRSFLSAGPAFFAAVDAKKIQLNESNGIDRNLEKLLRDEAHCFVNARLSVEHFMATIAGNRERRASYANIHHVMDVARHSAHIGYSRKYPLKYPAFPQKQLIATIDAAIKGLKAEGKFIAIAERYQQAIKAALPSNLTPEQDEQNLD